MPPLRQAGDREDHPITDLRQLLMHATGLIDESSRELAQGRDDQAGLIADQNDVPRQQRQSLHERFALPHELP
jgi:hypothetical protein